MDILQKTRPVSGRRRKVEMGRNVCRVFKDFKRKAVGGPVGSFACL